MRQNQDAKRWVMEARAKRDEAARLPHGERETGFQRLAGKDRNSQTLRRQIAALEFLERLVKETKYPSATKLEAFPVAAIEYLSRWYKRDVKGALQAADKLLRGEYDVKGLGAAEKKSRRHIFDTAGKALETSYRKAVEKRIEELVHSMVGSSVEIYKGHSLGDPLGVPDFSFRDPRTGGFPACVLICGPYRDKDLYRRRAFDWISKAYTLLNIFDVSFLILPDNADTHYFSRLLRRLAIDDYRLRVVHISSTKI